MCEPAFIHALILVLRGLLCSIFDPETESKCTFFSTNNAYTVSFPKQSGECCNRLSILLPYSSSNPHLLTLLLLSHNNNSIILCCFIPFAYGNALFTPVRRALNIFASNSPFVKKACQKTQTTIIIRNS